MKTKTPKCRECKGTGNIHIDIPQACNKVFDLPCWVCGGHNFKGMNREQVSWYLLVYKNLELMKSKSLCAHECVAPAAWLKMKNAINMACGKLGIKLMPILVPKPLWGQTHEFLLLREELAEYKRRLTQIPVVLAEKI